MIKSVEAGVGSYSSMHGCIGCWRGFWVKKNDQVLNCVIFTDMMKTNKLVILTERTSASKKEEKQR